MWSAFVVAGVITGLSTPAEWQWPTTDKVRMQRISKVEGEKDWPFVATKGMLACVPSLDRKVVVFIPDDGVKHFRGLYLDVNLLQMAVLNVGLSNMLAPYENPEELIKRIAPFVVMGQMLCKQKEPVVPGSEL